MVSREMRDTITFLRALTAEAAAAPPAASEAEELARNRGAGEAMAQAYPAPDDVAVERVDAGGVPADLLRPPGADEARAVLYLHGGAYVAYSAQSHRELAARIGRAAGAVVLVPDYRLAPEHPWPAGIDDCVAAYRWLLGTGRRVVVAGDSAGGGLALAVWQRTREDQPPLALALLSPWTDLELTGDSLRTVTDDPTLDPGRLDQAVHRYTAGADASHPEISPLRADLTGLPPTHVEVGTGEILLDDSTRLVERARAAGAEVSIEVGEGLPHVFPALAGTPEAQAATDRIGAFLRHHLGAGAAGE